MQLSTEITYSMHRIQYQISAAEQSMTVQAVPLISRMMHSAGFWFFLCDSELLLPTP